MSKELRRKLTLKGQVRHTSPTHVQQAYQQLWKWAQDEYENQPQEEEYGTDGPICPRINPPASPGSDD